LGEAPIHEILGRPQPRQGILRDSSRQEICQRTGKSMFQLKINSLSLKVLLAAVTLLACSSVLQFAAADYPGAPVESSGAGSQPVSATVSSPLKKAKPAGAGKFIAEGLSFNEFEETLDSSYVGSNFLYIKLSKSKRKRIYVFYQNDNRISSVREEIVRLLSPG
jgi:hypothetical protein